MTLRKLGTEGVTHSEERGGAGPGEVLHFVARGSVSSLTGIRYPPEKRKGRLNPTSRPHNPTTVPSTPL